MTLHLGLTEEQHKLRRQGIGGSDAKDILLGGDRWHALWLVKTGKAEPKSILSPWDAALRHHVEPLIMDWYQDVKGITVNRRGEHVTYKEWPILFAHLDGYAVNHPVDAKFLSAFTPGGMDWAIENYSAQMQHQMIVTGAEKGVLAVSLASKEPEFLSIERDPFFVHTYVERCKLFWGYVMRNEPPPKDGVAAGDEPKAAVKIDDMRTVDMNGNNGWANFAADWLANREAADKFDTADKGIRKLVESDVRLATGYGVQAKRDKAGRIRIAPMEKTV